MISEELRNEFLLQPDLTFLNFGSFGSCVKPLMNKYHQLQYEMELDPVDFIMHNLTEYLRESREALGEFINCAADDVVSVPSPTHAVNIVAKNLDLKPADEVLTTDIEYGACDRTWQYYCDKKGAKYVRQHINLPIRSQHEVVEDFFKGFTSRTKLIFISHITSATALILPVALIAKKAKELGVPIFIDGAHVPGHIELNIGQLQPNYYTGACHKWMMTPRGCSFLYVRSELQAALDPLIVSWGYNSIFPSGSQFLDYHQVNGTRDYTTYLTVPAAISFMEEYNWPEVSRQCRALCHDNAAELCQILNTQPLAPMEDAFLGQMFSAEIKTKDPEALHDILYKQYHIQIPIMRQDDRLYLRYSIQAFNTQADLDKLFQALRELRDSKIIE